MFNTEKNKIQKIINLAEQNQNQHRFIVHNERQLSIYRTKKKITVQIPINMKVYVRQTAQPGQRFIGNFPTVAAAYGVYDLYLPKLPNRQSVNFKIFDQSIVHQYSYLFYAGGQIHEYLTRHSLFKTWWVSLSEKIHRLRYQTYLSFTNPGQTYVTLLNPNYFDDREYPIFQYNPLSAEITINLLYE
jgi:hypothetical protein